MLWLNLLLVSIPIAGFLVVSLGFKTFINKNAMNSIQSCEIKLQENKYSEACDMCQIKELINCHNENLELKSIKK